MVVIFTTIFFISGKLLALEDIRNQQGIWVVRHNLISKDNIDLTINNIETLNIRNVYLQVRGRGYAYYNSAIEPKSPSIIDDFDPLSYFLSQARDKNINVHVWINTYLLWTAPNNPSNRAHLYYRQPAWFENNILTDNSRRENRNIYLSPHVDAVNQYLLKLITEIIDNYQIDGIHLDYVRYYNQFSGFHKEGLLGFNALNPDIPLQPRDLIYNDLWTKYRAERVEKFVESAKRLLAAKNENLLLSAAVKPNPVKAYINFGQNWPKWLNEQIVDHVIIMNYADNVKDFTENLNLVQSNCEITKVHCGIGLWNKPAKITSRQIKISGEKGFKNIVLFSYDTIIENNWIK
jgi:uncharacterized lipoprotein YddW (UPF0748 family)